MKLFYLLLFLPMLVFGQIDTTLVSNFDRNQISPRYTTEELNVRSGPSKDYDLLYVFTRGAAVTVLGCGENEELKIWCAITSPINGNGWVAGRYLSVNPPSENLPSPRYSPRTPRNSVYSNTGTGPSGRRWRCSDFSSPAAAQQAYDSDPTEYAMLDRDGDGDVCEQPDRNTATPTPRSRRTQARRNAYVSSGRSTGSRQCSAIAKSTGRRCTRMTTNASGRCWQH